MILTMKPPVEPNKDDCCNSGCNPCIFEVFERQLRLYNSCKENNTSVKTEENGISQLEYTKFFVIDIVELNENQRLIKFKKSKHESNIQVYWNAGDHFLLKYEEETISCSRAYTPIKLKKNCNEDFDFMIVIKKYGEGLVSKYLFSLQNGNQTLWRGPYGHYIVIPNKLNRVVMIAQGTGIAPLISIIDTILNNEEDMTKIVLFLCSRNLNETLFRTELYEFKSYWNFQYHLLLSDSLCENKDKPMYGEPIIERKLKTTDVLDLKPSNNDQFLLCGSKQFMKDFEHVFKNELFLENIVVF